MQRTDASYIYELGAHLRPIKMLGHANMPYWQAYGPLIAARDHVQGFVFQSIYSESLRLTIQTLTNKLLTELQNLIAKITIPGNSGDDQITLVDYLPTMNAFAALEPVLLSELSSATTFIVSPKGGFDAQRLVERPADLFPQSLPNKVPGAMQDITDGCKCMAYELWTATAFHLHRANEAVLREYFDMVAGKGRRPKIRTMSSMVKRMTDDKVGDQNILAGLNNLIVFHRNPVAHPGYHIPDSETTFSLYAAVRAAMGYMLDQLPLSAKPNPALEVGLPPLVELFS